MSNLPSVTEVIGFCNSQAFANVSPERLEVASVRGQEFHQLAAAYLLSLPILEVPEECEGYFTSFRRWADSMVEEVVLVEERLVCPAYGFTGMPDLVCRLKGDDELVLGDYKTGQVASKGWRLQTAAYRYLAEKKLARIITRTFSLQPRPDGKRAKFLEYSKSLTPDFAVFLSALQVFKFFNEG